MASPTRGALIAIEGLDRAGKSTQCSLLLDRLRAENHPATLQKFPDRTTPIGQMINTYLQSSTALDDRAIHLLFSANRWEARDSLLETLASGTTILLDRYIYSGIVFSAAKQSHPSPSPPHGPLSTSWCRSPDVGLPRPDIVIFLDISQDAAAARGGYGQERYEKAEMQARVRALFEEMRADERDKEDWWVVDAGGDVEEVADAVWAGVQEGIRRAKQRPAVRAIE
ncbi:hypothetical protein Dda_8519 [Drechslerella dactyloides]|uniref:Thymidylate kinase n=1 Tax=Drechslerella dactyloides TaxID=74499 RepID=A0AAD6IRN2_DREDA|nr:hypothetical protein Dda_8519 [Drechslerella dactyloides]